jgi:hypothetical protein
VYLQDGSGNRVQGNFAGTAGTGTATLGNLGSGVLIQSSGNNTIGGADSAAMNLLSGNADNGVTLILAAASDNVIQGNRIGTDRIGTLDLGNGFHGIFAFQAPRTIIGGTADGAGNLISGNNEDGVRLEDNSNDTLIQGNRIGTNAAGTAALGNGQTLAEVDVEAGLRP